MDPQSSANHPFRAHWQEPTTLSRSITIGRRAESIYRRWQEPQTLPRPLDNIAGVTHLAHNRLHWRMVLPMRQTLVWDSTIVEAVPHQRVHWQSVEGATVSTRARSY
jgi:uncharacterized membrane protein